MKTFRNYASQRAFTLIELMIAMLIGVFLMMGVIQIFSSAKQAYRLQENLSRLQENGRFAIDMMTKDMRMAGFAGCLSKTTALFNNNTNPTTPANTNPKPEASPTFFNAAGTPTATSSGISGEDNVTSTSICATNQCIAGTDAISFQSASPCGGQLTVGMTPDNTGDLKIDAANTCAIKTNDVLLVANCTQADIFIATSVTPTSPSPLPAPNTATQTIAHAATQNKNNKLSTGYGTDAELFVYKLVSYFIRTGDSGSRALWRVDNTKSTANTPPVELIDGIQDMQILYGVDSDLIPDYVANYYVTQTQLKGNPTVNSKDSAGNTTAVDTWTRVVSVRINLLAVTLDNNLTDTPQPYTYNGATTTPPQIAVLKTNTSQLCPPYTGTLPTKCQLANDLRIRRVFSSTIAVRNRLL